VTMTAAEARKAGHAEIVILAEISLLNSGPTLYLADRTVTIGAQRYEDYLAECPDITEECKREDSTGQNADVELIIKNDPYETYSHLVKIGEDHPWVGATVAIKETYVVRPDYPGAVPEYTTPVTLFAGVCRAPEEITTRSFKLNCQSWAEHRDQTYNPEVILSADWPDADPAVIGQPIPIIYGGPFDAPLLPVVWNGGRDTTVSEVLSAAATHVHVEDCSEFKAASANIRIGQELITYGAKDDDTGILSSLTREIYSSAHTDWAAVGSVVRQVPDANAALKFVAGRKTLYSYANIRAIIGSKRYADVKGITITSSTSGNVHYLAFPEGHQVPNLYNPSTGSATEEDPWAYGPMPDGFFAKLAGHKAPSAEYGTDNSLVERPDWVIKHILVVHAGFGRDTEIDDDSFAAAGTSYGSNYKVGVYYGNIGNPVQAARRIAYENRSMLYYQGGKWYLTFLPDTAPAATVTVERELLDGGPEGGLFEFWRGEYANAVNIRYKQNYVKAGSRVEWKGQLILEDIDLGLDRIEEDIDLITVRNATHADLFGDYRLLQKKTPLLYVKFTALWDYFDLKIGDTFDTDDECYGGTKFLVEKTERKDKYKVTITGVAWW
jgi:hypothetical protein